MNFLWSRNAQNGDEKHSVSNSYESNNNFALATFPWHNKTAKKRYKGVATKFSNIILDSKNKNKQQNKKHGCWGKDNPVPPEAGKKTRRGV